MSTNKEVRNTLAPGHSASGDNHADHTSTYSVTKLQNCEYTYNSGGKQGKNQDTDDAADKPGGINHMDSVHKNGDPNQWNDNIDTSGRQVYSGITG